jgi:ElaB/YqjD/DUF883 family membrane-anchored ribosome-binding protein
MERVKSAGRHQSNSTARIRARAEDAGDAFKDIGDIIRTAIKNRLADLLDSALTYGLRGRERVKEGSTSIRKTVTEQIESRPIGAVFLAAGIGFLAGAMFRRR